MYATSTELKLYEYNVGGVVVSIERTYVQCYLS